MLEAERRTEGEFFAFGGSAQGPGPRWKAWWLAALRGEAREEETLPDVDDASPWMESRERAVALGRELARRVPKRVDRLAEALAHVPHAEGLLLRGLEMDASLWCELMEAPAARLRRFARIASCSEVYGRWLAQDARALLDPDGARAEACGRVEALLRSSGRGPEARAAFVAALRARKRATLVDVLDDELTQREGVRWTAARISDVADAAIGDALAWALDEQGARGMGCAVLGMGKLGARELNLSSDVDLIHVYERDAADGTGEARAVAVARSVNQLVEERTSDGLVFRVDVRLRPFGTRGALSVRRDGAIAYYEAYGRTWERGAWIKARQVAGDGDTGERLIRALRPFVYRRSLDEAAIGEVAAMKASIDAEQARRGAAGGSARGVDLKLGRGGIREIEFFVQAFALVWGGREPLLAVAPTVTALERLSEAGLVPERERARLASAYLFLRTLEHRVQMQEEQQTHVLPATGDGARRVALRMGFATPEGLRGALDEHRAHVTRAWKRLFGGEAAERVESWVAVATDEGKDPAVRREALRSAGFVQDRRWLHEIDTMAGPPTPLLGPHAQGNARASVEGLIEACAEAADPDRALERTVEILLQRAGRESLLRIASAGERPRAVLVGLFGWSDHLGRILARDAALLEGLLTDAATPRASRTGLEGRLERALSAEDARATGAMRERRLHRLRRFRHGEEIRVALAEIGGRVAPWEAMADLTSLACAMVSACHAEVAADMGLDAAEAARVGAVAFGKLAGGEMGHASDLDLVLVFEGGVEHVEMASRFARRWIAFLSAPMVHGRLYPVDMRLRPDGGQGTVVTSVDGFFRYYDERAWAWERLALVRSRPIVGLPERAEEFERRVEGILDGLDRDGLRAELREIRARRLGERGASASYKLRNGGLADLELLLMVLQVDARQAGLWEGAREPGARAGLARLRACGALDESAGQVAAEALTFFRQLEMWLRLIDGESAGAVPESDRLASSILSRVVGRGGGGEALRGAVEEQAERVAGLLGRFGLVDDAR